MNESAYKRLLARLEPQVRDAFLDSVQNMQDDVAIRQLENALQSQDVPAALEALNLDPSQFSGLEEALRDAMREGGQEEMDAQQRHARTLAMYFSIGNPRAERIAREHSSSLVTGLLEEARTAVRERIATGISTGTNPITTARTIAGTFNRATGGREGGIVGLAENQQTWVRNAELELQNLSRGYFKRRQRDKRFDSTVNKAIKSGRPLPPETRERILRKYRAKLLKLRGETIARTESIASLNAGRMEATQQLIDRGMITPDLVTKTWSSTLDSRLRDAHRTMHNQKQAFDAPFRSPTGAQLQYPGDISLGAEGEDVINCRCYVEIRIDWIERARRRRRAA